MAKGRAKLIPRHGYGEKNVLGLEYAYDENLRLCYDFIRSIQKALGDDYILRPSCNQDVSLYLIPKDSIDQLSYVGKPEKSYRMSNHWNWYSNLKKCPDESMVQCFSPDLPAPKQRKAPGKASDPIDAVCVCEYLNGEYHVIFGQKYDHETKQFVWVN